MPVYRGNCDNCGYANEQFLQTDKEAMPYKCKGCKLTITITQTRDRTQVLKDNNGVTGVFHHDSK